MEHSTIETADASPALASFTVDTAALSQAVDLLARHVALTRGSVPILSYLRIKADPAGSLAIEACDLDQSCTVTIAGEAASPGALCLDAGALQSVLAKLRKVKGAVRIDDTGEGRATISAGANRFKVPTLPVDDFPRVSGPTDGADAPLSRFMLPAGRFLADLAALAPVMSKEEQRYYLRGIAMQRRELAGRDRLVMVATDGHGMAIASRALPDGADALADAILPAGMVRTIGKAAKLIGEAGAAAVAIDGERITISAGPVTFTAKLIDGTYPDWCHGNLWGEGGSCAPTDGEAVALFPDLLPGAPVAMLEKLAKPFRGALSWAPARGAMLGTVAGDDGLLFAAMNMARDDSAGRKGFSYVMTGRAEAQAYLLALAEARGLPLPADMQAAMEAINADGPGTGAWHRGNGELIQRGGRVIGITVGGGFYLPGWTETVLDWEALVEREIWHPERHEPINGSYSILAPADCPQPECASTIIGPDGVSYPVAMSETAIHFSKDQVRALIGESCFETMEVQPGSYVLRWLWEQGDSRFLIVGRDGRIKDEGRRYLTREQVQAALDGVLMPAPTVEAEAMPADMPEIAASAAQETQEPAPVAPEGVEPVEALSGPEIGSPEPSSNAEQLPGDPLADVLARLDAMEARLAAIADGGAIMDASAPTLDASVVIMDGAPIRTTRTSAHERAVRRAWAERKARRATVVAMQFQVQLRTDLQANAERGKQYYREIAEAETLRANAAVQKRRRAVLLAKRHWKMRIVARGQCRAAEAEARQERAARHMIVATGRALSVQARAQRDRETARAAVLAAQLDKAGADLIAARRIQTYTDGAGREAPDNIGRTFQAAQDIAGKADKLAGDLAAARAAIARQDAAISGLGDALEAATSRAIQAERALAAVTARRDGWPPAVRSVAVSFGGAAAA